MAACQLLMRLATCSLVGSGGATDGDGAATGDPASREGSASRLGTPSEAVASDVVSPAGDPFLWCREATTPTETTMSAPSTTAATRESLLSRRGGRFLSDFTAGLLNQKKSARDHSSPFEIDRP